MRFFVLILSMLAAPVFSATFVGKILDGAAIYNDKPEHRYLLSVEKVIEGALTSQYKIVSNQFIASTQLIGNGRRLLVSTNEFEDNILTVLPQSSTDTSLSEPFVSSIGKSLSAILNEQNRKYDFLNHGRIVVAVVNNGDNIELAYDKVHIKGEALLIIDYYIKNRIAQLSEYIKPNHHIVFKVSVKGKEFSVLPDKYYGGYVSLDVALSKYAHVLK